METEGCWGARVDGWAAVGGSVGRGQEKVVGSPGRGSVEMWGGDMGVADTERARLGEGRACGIGERRGAPGVDSGR